MKVFISVPMRGRTNEEINNDIAIAKGKLAEMAQENNEYIIYVDNFVGIPLKNEINDIENPSMWYLGAAIQKMSECDAIYFCPGWCGARGCVIERHVAVLYGLTRLYQNDELGIIFQESADNKLMEPMSVEVKN
jgi:hypothetical protein